MTDKVKKAAELMDIKLLDHLILTKDSYYSFAEYGILNGKRCELRATKLESRGKWLVISYLPLCVAV